jgi:hypothetical protein
VNCRSVERVHHVHLIPEDLHGLLGGVGLGVAAVARVVVEGDEGHLHDLVAVLDADVGVALVGQARRVYALGQHLLAGLELVELDVEGDAGDDLLLHEAPVEAAVEAADERGPVDQRLRVEDELGAVGVLDRQAAVDLAGDPVGRGVLPEGPDEHHAVLDEVRAAVGAAESGAVATDRHADALVGLDPVDLEPAAGEDRDEGDGFAGALGGGRFAGVGDARAGRVVGLGRLVVAACGAGEGQERE